MSLDLLPSELILHIAKYLRLPDLYRWSMTSTRYQELCLDPQSLAQRRVSSYSQTLIHSFINQEGVLTVFIYILCSHCGSTRIPRLQTSRRIPKVVEPICRTKCHYCSHQNCRRRMTTLMIKTEELSRYRRICSTCIEARNDIVYDEHRRCYRVIGDSVDSELDDSDE